MVYGKGDAYVIDSGMQVAARFGERVRVWLVAQIEPQKLGRVTVRELVMVSEGYDL